MPRIAVGVAPARRKTGDIATPQHHVRVFVEGFQRVGLVVLGTHGEDDAALGQIAGVTLEVHEGLAGGAALAQYDAFEPVVTDDSAPERVVEIEHEAFERPPLPRREQPPNQITVKRREPGVNVLLRPVPQDRVIPGVQPVFGGVPVDRDQVDAFRVGMDTQVLIQPRHQSCRGAGEAVLVIPRKVRKHRQYRLLDDFGAKRIARDTPLLDQLVKGGIKPLFRLVGRLGDRKATQEMPRVEGEQDIGRRPLPQRRIWITERLGILSVIALPGRDPESATQPRNADARMQMIDGRRPKHGEAHRARRQPRRWRCTEHAQQMAVEAEGTNEVQSGIREADEFRPGGTIRDVAAGWERGIPIRVDR